MSNLVNPFDFVGEDLATFLAKSVDDGTYADIFEALKTDAPGQEAPATAISVASGQLLSNAVDDFILEAYPLLRIVATGTGVRLVETPAPIFGGSTPNFTYSIAADERIGFTDSVVGTLNVTLPPIASVTPGQEISIRLILGNPNSSITLTPDAADGVVDPATGTATAAGVPLVIGSRTYASGVTLTWQAVGVGRLAWAFEYASIGDVQGPSSATDKTIAVYDGSTGKLIKTSNVIADGDDLTVPGNATLDSANPLLLMGDGGGVTTFRMDADLSTGSSNIQFFKNNALKWLIQNNTAQNFRINSNTFGNILEIIETSGLATWAAGVTVKGQLIAETGLSVAPVALTTTPGVGVFADTNTDLTNKFGRLLAQAYDTSQGTWSFIAGQSLVSTNRVLVGGGMTGIDAATKIDFFTAGAVNTAPGTLRMTIDSSGDVVMNGGDFTTRREIFNGTALVAGDFALSAGWGATASAVVGGTDSGGFIEVTAGGSGIASSPTITLTFTDGAWAVAPFAIVSRNDFTVTLASASNTRWSTSTTTLVIETDFTPNGANTYRFDFSCRG